MSGVHANFKELSGDPSANAEVLPPEVKSKMSLSHYQDFVTKNTEFDGKPCLDEFDNPITWDERAAQAGFKGFIKVGQEIEL
jgi:hypothetical protein